MTHHGQMPGAQWLQPEYRISLTLAVEDGGALWDAAAVRMLATGLSQHQLAERIGLREDPSIKDCILALALPSGVAGCRFEDAWIDSLGQPVRLRC